MTAQFLGLPTWLLYRALRQWLPSEHPWKYPLSLGAWAQGMTPLCLVFSIGLWNIGLGVLISVALLVKHWVAS